jgi:acyl-CoA thioesterase-1
MKYVLIIALLLISSVGIFFYNFNNTDEDSNTVNEKSQQTGKTFKIVAFGDSLTAGYGVKLEESYPSILEKELKKENMNIEVVNIGVSGETTTGGLERLDFVLSQEPDLVLLGLGANDMLRATSPDIAKANLEKMILTFKDKNIPVILLGMESQISNSFAYKKKFDVIYKDLAKKHSLALVPFFLENVVLVKSLNIEDGIHPNKQGYEKIVQENVLPVISKVLKAGF